MVAETVAVGVTTGLASEGARSFIGGEPKPTDMLIIDLLTRMTYALEDMSNKTPPKLVAYYAKNESRPVTSTMIIDKIILSVDVATTILFKIGTAGYRFAVGVGVSEIAFHITLKAGIDIQLVDEGATTKCYMYLFGDTD